MIALLLGDGLLGLVCLTHQVTHQHWHRATACSFVITA